jgi:hypothetical protein
MASAMITDLKKGTSLDPELVEHILYRELIGSLVYLVNTRLDIC